MYVLVGYARSKVNDEKVKSRSLRISIHMLIACILVLLILSGADAISLRSHYRDGLLAALTALVAVDLFWTQRFTSETTEGIRAEEQPRTTRGAFRVPRLDLGRAIIVGAVLGALLSAVGWRAAAIAVFSITGLFVLIDTFQH
jgi:hypothetical protein